MYENIVCTEMGSIINNYNVLNNRLHFDIEDDTNKDRFKFRDQNDFINVMVLCRDIITASLKLYVYLTSGDITEPQYENTKELYKQSQIRITHIVTYHDLKDVFAIIDIAASDRSNTTTINNVAEESIDNIYAAMMTIILQTERAFSIKFGIGGVRRRGRPRKSEAVAKEA